jgi:hypothetical protein
LVPFWPPLKTCTAGHQAHGRFGPPSTAYRCRPSLSQAVCSSIMWRAQNFRRRRRPAAPWPGALDAFPSWLAMASWRWRDAAELHCRATARRVQAVCWTVAGRGRSSLPSACSLLLSLLTASLGWFAGCYYLHMITLKLSSSSKGSLLINTDHRWPGLHGDY